MADKTHPYGYKFLYAAATGETSASNFTALSDIRSIKPGGLTVGKTDTTILESTNAHRENIPGWGETDDATFTAYFTKAQLTTILGLYRTQKTFRISKPLIGTETTASLLTWNGHITSVDEQEGSTDDEALMVNFAVAVSGKPTYSAGS